MSQRATAPRHCPACATELYPIARMRPQPALSLTAKLLLTIGILASAAIFIGGMVWSMAAQELWRQKHRGPTVEGGGGISGMIMLFPALVPGLIFGWIAYRLPKTLTLQCSRCPWRERYKLGFDGQVTSMGITPMPTVEDSRQAREINRQFAQISTAAPLPPAPNEFGHDGNPEVSAWIYAEIATGRSPEDVAAQLLEMGWQPDVAEHLAEIGRRQTRHLRR